jgi:hypothetical protein
VGVLKETAGLSAKLLLKGQTNFVQMLFKFNGAFNAEKLFADHQEPADYKMHLPGAAAGAPGLLFFQVSIVTKAHMVVVQAVP